MTVPFFKFHFCTSALRVQSVQSTSITINCPRCFSVSTSLGTGAKRGGTV